MGQSTVFFLQVILGKLMLLPEGYHQKTYQRGSWEWYRSTAVSDFVNPHRAMIHSGLSGTDVEVWVCASPHGSTEARWIHCGPTTDVWVFGRCITSSAV